MAKGNQQSPLAFKPAARELLGEIVIVRTPKLIGGKNEHAAIVTAEHESGAIDVVLFPSDSESYPIENVAPASAGAALHWRHRR